MHAFDINRPSYEILAYIRNQQRVACCGPKGTTTCWRAHNLKKKEKEILQLFIQFQMI